MSSHVDIYRAPLWRNPNPNFRGSDGPPGVMPGTWDSGKLEVVASGWVGCVSYDLIAQTINVTVMDGTAVPSDWTLQS